MTRAEVRRAAETVGMDVLDFCRMYLAEYDQGFSLRELAGGDCCMLDGGKCRIYAARPMQCRTWPWWPSNLRSRAAWREAARRCPGIGRGHRWSLTEIVAERDKMDI
jgi:Fe-S-cluster containining protein